MRASSADEFDFAFFDPYFIPAAVRKRLANRLKVPHFKHPRIGDEVGIAGYPFGKNRLVGHKCRISSIYESGPATMFQLEGSINASNSGGPLFNLEENAVFGIVTRKEHGLSDHFKPLLETLEKRVESYKEPNYFGAECNKKVQDALVATQEGLRALAVELRRSSNTGIGYAISIRHLLGNEAFQEKALPDPMGRT